MRTSWSNDPEFVFDIPTPGAAVLSLAEIKTACRIELVDDDPNDPDTIARNAELQSHEAYARSYCEAYVGQVFTPTTFRMLSPFPAKDGKIYLRKYPVTAVATLRIMDLTTGTYSTKTINTDYIACLVGTEPYLTPSTTQNFFPLGQTLPSRQDAIEVVMTAGYPAGKLPARFIDAIRVLVVHRFENPSNIEKIPDAVHRLLGLSKLRRKGNTW